MLSMNNVLSKRSTESLYLLIDRLVPDRPFQPFLSLVLDFPDHSLARIHHPLPHPLLLVPVPSALAHLLSVFFPDLHKRLQASLGIIHPLMGHPARSLVELVTVK